MPHLVEVLHHIEVTVDETKFDEQFMSEFRESFYPFMDLEDHLKHLGQLYARGLADDYSFIEGYGPAQDMGIKFKEYHLETDILNQG